jgi:crotonobetainyl-CoA:carnitine CoA-transferase CaiB-like acyl-CoA transferase
MSGICDALRQPDQYPPTNLGGPIADLASALYAVIGMLAALNHRNRTGRGQYVDVAMLDSMMAMADMVPFMWSLAVPHPARRAAGLVASFKARDGFFVISVLREHQFKRLAELIGRPEWLTDGRFKERQGWVDHLDAVIRPSVEEWAKDKTRLEASNLMSARGIAAGPYFTAPDLVQDEHVRMRNMLVDVPKPDGSGKLSIVGNPIKMSGMADGPVRRWPRVGEHTGAILQDLLGLGSEELSALRDRGVISGTMAGA